MQPLLSGLTQCTQVLIRFLGNGVLKIVPLVADLNEEIGCDNAHVNATQNKKNKFSKALKTELTLNWAHYPTVAVIELITPSIKNSFQISIQCE